MQSYVRKETRVVKFETIKYRNLSITTLAYWTDALTAGSNSVTCMTSLCVIRTVRQVITDVYVGTLDLIVNNASWNKMIYNDPLITNIQR